MIDSDAMYLLFALDLGGFMGVGAGWIYSKLIEITDKKGD